MKHAMPLARGEQPITTRTNVPTNLRGAPFKKGHDPRRNVTTGGRHSDEFKASMRVLASADDVLAALRAILTDHLHPHFMHAFKYAADRGYGKPQVHIDVTSSGRSLADVLHEGRDRIARMRDAREPDGVQ